LVILHKTLRHLLDPRVEAPPLLDHDDPGT
jgi:hypothetical protein